MRGLLLFLVAASFVGPLAVSAQDRDGDRLLDDVDLCPALAEGRATLFPGDGCPDVDSDGDRIVDDHDFCPGAPETANGFEDADGCPDAEGASVQALADRIHFATGSHELDYAALVEVARVATWLEAHPEATHVQVVGRGDARGSAAQNDFLSLRRAASVQHALVERGIASPRLTARGLGALPGDTPRARADDRRVELHVALDGTERDAVDLSRFSGVYVGDTHADLRVGSSARDATASLHPFERGWRLTAYAGRRLGDRMVLVLAGAGREETLVLRVVGDRALGILEVRSAGSVRRVAWTARYEPFFDQGAVVRAITGHRPEIQACYERELREERTLHGRLTIAMTVLETGDTESVRVAEDAVTPPRPALGACVVAIVDALDFHPAPTGGSVSFMFPFIFEPQDD